jgi:hypothetical protein
MEVRSKKLSLGKKTVIATVGIQISGTLRDLMYGLLIKVLLDKEIGQIRCCKVCGRFTHDTTKPKLYCSQKCHDVFWNADEDRKNRRKKKRLETEQSQRALEEQQRGRSLFMKVQQLANKPKRTSYETDFLSRVQALLMVRNLSLNRAWQDQTVETQKEFVRIVPRL